jgi:hypothetical protein
MTGREQYPSIADAKALSVKYRRRGVIVLSFGGRLYSATSYGMTRRDCSAMAAVSNRICDLIGNGTIQLPDGLEVELSAQTVAADSGQYAALLERPCRPQRQGRRP